MAAMPNHQAIVIAGTREGTDRFTGRARASAAGDDDKSREICLSQSNESRRSEEERAAWEPNLQPAILTMAGHGARVSALHVERVVEEGDDRATLEVIDAWVDIQSRGARLIGRAKLPLKLVARAPGDIRVYAMRDKDRMQVVLVEPTSTARTWQGIIQTGDQGTSTSGCRHARAELALERGTGETSTFVVTAELPATAADKELVAESASGSAGLEAVRTRPMLVHASASWASREAEPVLAVAVGWAARDRSATVFRTERPKVAKK